MTLPPADTAQAPAPDSRSKPLSNEPADPFVRPGADETNGFQYRLWLHLLALLLMVGTGILIFMGGRVTTMGAGLAVPDWPTTFHHNMFFVPFNLWWNNSPVFAEHSHRLMGSAIGIVSIALAIGLWVTQKQRPWLRWFGLLVLAMVIAQGIMGGLRVTDKSQTLAFVHGIFGQIFFGCTVLAATAVGPVWLKLRRWPAAAKFNGQDHLKNGPGVIKNGYKLRFIALLLLGLLVVQIALGSSLRHTSSVLAIPDFPASYGHVLPPVSHQQLHRYQGALSPTQSKHLHLSSSPYTLTQIWLNFVHTRAWVTLITVLALFVMLWAPIVTRGRRELRLPIMLFSGLLALQILLGISVIWSGRWAPFATAHQTCGAIMFGAAAWLGVRIFLTTQKLPAQETEKLESQNNSADTIPAH